MAGSRYLIALSLAAGFVAGGAPVVAHHSAAAAYDETRKVEAQGTVTRVMVKNPHSWIFLDGTDDKGQKVEWQIEMGGVTSMAWTKEALPVGTVVKAVGHPSRAPGSHGMTAAVFSKPDGTPIGPRGGRGDSAQR
jgi:hypothetical protein